MSLFSLSNTCRILRIKSSRDATRIRSRRPPPPFILHHNNSNNLHSGKYHENSPSHSFSTTTDSDTNNDEKNDNQVLLTVDKSTKIATLTLNSPQTYNALSISMSHSFQRQIATLKSHLESGEIDANALILTGSGKAFSSGGDLDWLRSLRDNPVHVNSDHMNSFYRRFLCMRDLPIPIIAAIDGPAIGAGACLAIASDVIVAARDAKIGFNFATLGIHAGMGGSHFLPLRLGRCGLVNEVLFTGKIFDGEEAGRVGLVSRVVTEKGDVLGEAKRLANEMVRRHPLAVRSMVRSVRMGEDEGLEGALRREADNQALCYARGDWGEGLEAAVERRDPVFDHYHAK